MIPWRTTARLKDGREVPAGAVMPASIIPAFVSTYALAAICCTGGWPVFAIACAWSVAAHLWESAAGAAWSGPLVGAVLAVVLVLGVLFENEALLFALGNR